MSLLALEVPKTPGVRFDIRKTVGNLLLLGSKLNGYSSGMSFLET